MMREARKEPRLLRSRGEVAFAIEGAIRGRFVFGFSGRTAVIEHFD